VVFSYPNISLPLVATCLDNSLPIAHVMNVHVKVKNVKAWEQSRICKFHSLWTYQTNRNIFIEGNM